MLGSLFVNNKEKIVQCPQQDYLILLLNIVRDAVFTCAAEVASRIMQNHDESG